MDAHFFLTCFHGPRWAIKGRKKLGAYLVVRTSHSANKRYLNGPLHLQTLLRLDFLCVHESEISSRVPQHPVSRDKSFPFECHRKAIHLSGNN